MKNLLKITSMVFAMLFAMVSLVSCSADETTNYYDVNVENVTVLFNTNDLIVEQSEQFARNTTMSVTEYVHSFPTTYTAYFVSKENRGQYTMGQTVATITVLPGDNQITIPSLDYDIYVTNFVKEGNWYTWPDAIQQLPQSTSSLYLFGSTNIDYKTTTVGSVTLRNPYAAVMIKASNYIPSAPMFYNDSQYYNLVSGVTSDWHLRYLRTNNTNTMVPLNIPGYSSNQYTLNKAIEANNVYKYTINGDAAEGDGSFTVIVEPFVGEHDETIEIF